MPAPPSSHAADFDIIDSDSALIGVSNYEVYSKQVQNIKRKEKNNITHSANRPGKMIPNSLCYNEQACTVIVIFATKFIKHSVL